MTETYDHTDPQIPSGDTAGTEHTSDDSIEPLEPSARAHSDQDEALRKRITEAVSKRIRRYDTFEDFYKNCKETFRRLADADEDILFFEKLYSFYVVAGTAQGANNRLAIDVFFGLRPYDKGLIINQRTLATEAGARLHYTRTDRGEVRCELIPARTEREGPEELHVLLGTISDPGKLLNESTLKRHLRLLTAYMAKTSVDGHPSIRQWLEYQYLYWFKRFYTGKKKKKLRRTRARREAKRLGRWVLTIGLSGSLLLLLQKCSPSPDESAVAINRAAESAREDAHSVRTALNNLSALADKNAGAQQTDAKRIIEQLDAILARSSPPSLPEKVDHPRQQSKNSKPTTNPPPRQ